MRSVSSFSTPAIVLGMHGTGLATAWCLSDAGVQVDGVSQSTKEPGRSSSRIRLVDLTRFPDDESFLDEWLFNYARKLGTRPVVLPVSDEQALRLARHQHQLAEVCRIWTTSYPDLNTIISKEGLYALGARCGVRVPPMCVEPELAELKRFCAEHRGPYLAKPYYNGVGTCALREKNRIFSDEESLLAYATKHGTAALIVQQILHGGDGWIYDAYGLCRKDGSIAVLASHKRIRQHPAGFGATSYGEIPAAPVGLPEEALFEQTRQLLAGIRYHGIFGIEWLQERATGHLYLIDFNARPFSSIGHLKDCGLNLPLLAYRDLHDDPLDDVPPIPRLAHKFWIEPVTDLRTAKKLCDAGELTWPQWVASVLRAKSFAPIDGRDLGPALYQSWEMIDISARFLARRLKARSQR